MRVPPLILMLTFLSPIISNSEAAETARGVYDYNQTFTTAPGIAYELLFLESWAVPDTFYPQEASTLTGALQLIAKRGRTPILSVQPFHSDEIGSASSLLGDVAAGRYDAVIANLCALIKAYRGSVLIRWGHEMDFPQNIGRYDWATNNPAAYIAAYRHAIILFSRYLGSHAAYIWSPGGAGNANRYYPGDAYCQYVGCTVFSWSLGAQKWGWGSSSFASIFGPRYNALATHGKQIIICEFGISRSDDQAAWTADAVSTFPKFPRLKAVIYFNSKDNVSWWPWGPVPDWSISPLIWR
jgi:endoglucanase